MEKHGCGRWGEGGIALGLAEAEAMGTFVDVGEGQEEATEKGELCSRGM